ncbi:hypothetical protein ABZV52_30230 [Streptomyces sp. NPDC004735]|uniref:hypothetical protein n=1 Tax=Streptomyces TaxID=1883 RepID=UPI0033A9983F
MHDSFAAKHASLIAAIRTARHSGDERTAGLALQELLAAYARLANRQAGTVDEQNAYIVARRLGSIPDALADLGVQEADAPMPATRRAAAPPPESSAEAEARIAERFAHIGEAADPEDHFTVEYRPQDDMRLNGRPAPYAIIATYDGLPVAWYPERDWADTIAGTASRLRHSA